MATEKKKTKPFQIAMIVVFAVLIVGAVIAFSNADRKNTNPEGGGVNYGPVTVWGTVPASGDMTQLFAAFNKTYENVVAATYVHVPIDALEQKLLEALSNDTGPDVLILPNQWLHRNVMRITPIPYDPLKGGMGVREFKDTFTQAGEIFLYPEGIMAMPLVIDPLILYWNRDLFTNANIVSPPTSWKEVLALTAKLTKKKNLDILESTIALGEYENVNRAKDILSLMFLQVGSPITTVSAGGSLSSVFNQHPAVIQAVRFYVDFANPLKSGYSWNRSLPSAQDAFLANELAMYIDLASEYKTLSVKNPRLNFDIAPVPQTDGQPTAVTSGSIHGVTVLKKGKNVPGGIMFAKFFSTKLFAELFAEVSGMAPMRRDLLSVPKEDAFQATLYSAALRARSWIDPQPVRSNEIFSRMIEAVLSGKSDAESAVSQADFEMSALISGK